MSNPFTLTIAQGADFCDREKRKRGEALFFPPMMQNPNTSAK